VDRPLGLIEPPGRPVPSGGSRLLPADGRSRLLCGDLAGTADATPLRRAVSRVPVSSGPEQVQPSMRSAAAPRHPGNTEALMLDRPDDLDRTLVHRYEHLLPASLVRSTLDASPAGPEAQADLDALADAVRRSPQAAPHSPR